MSSDASQNQGSGNGDQQTARLQTGAGNVQLVYLDPTSTSGSYIPVHTPTGEIQFLRMATVATSKPENTPAVVNR